MTKPNITSATSNGTSRLQPLPRLARRSFLTQASLVLAGATVSNGAAAKLWAGEKPANSGQTRGSQRLSLEKLQAWEKLGYGMFIHFGMSTFMANELPDGKSPASTYAPDQLDVAQWVSVARDAGMKYAILTTKHVAGHCLWPTKCTDYSVANSTNRTDVVEKFVNACRDKGVLSGFIIARGTTITGLAARPPRIQPAGTPCSRLLVTKPSRLPRLRSY